MRRILVAVVVPVSLGAAAWWLWPRATPVTLDADAARLPAPWVERITPETLATRPNILLVVYDARRRDDFSFGPFGNRRGDTPFLEEFVEDAVYFVDAVSPGCWTVPVHASIFSGLSICELGIDYYNSGLSSFATDFLSLAEILNVAGYHTVAYPDHPYFYHPNLTTTLVRGFEQFNVISEFTDYGSDTNIGTPDGRVERHERLDGLDEMPREELDDLIVRFNAGEIRFDLETDADYDSTGRFYVAPLYDMFRESPYFRKRYGQEFDQHVFTGDDNRPFFLFLNLHMCHRARPAPGLLSRWLLRNAMLNAQHQGASLTTEPSDGSVGECLERNLTAVGLMRTEPTLQMKQIFDNRFYDACFRGVWEYLEARGLAANTATVVTSDHGVSFGEHGEAKSLHAGARPYEYLIRVPLILRFPPGTEHATLHERRTEKVSLTDIFQTLVDLGVGPDVFIRERPVRGDSLIYRLRENEFDPVVVAESSLFPSAYRVQPEVIGYCKAVYTGPLKLIAVPDARVTDDYKALVKGRLEDSSTASTEPLAELYDLAADPHETTNLASPRAQIVEELLHLLSEWACVPNSGSSETPRWSDDAVRTLRALGYLQ